MKRLLSAVFLLTTIIANSQEIDPTHIYDKLDTGRYAPKDPVTGTSYLPIHQTISTTQTLHTNAENVIRSLDNLTATTIPKTLYSLNFSNSPIEWLTSFYKDVTGTNILTDDSTHPNVTLITSNRVDREEMLALIADFFATNSIDLVPIDQSTLKAVKRGRNEQPQQEAWP